MGELSIRQVVEEMEQKLERLKLLATISPHEKGVLQYYLNQRWIPSLKRFVEEENDPS